MSTYNDQSTSPLPQPPQEQDRAPRRDEQSRKIGRLRSSCDSCHRSKIKCTGSNPCSACLGSQSTCTYSRGSKLGRPKGSKNKRTLSNESGQEQDRIQRSTARLSTDLHQWQQLHLTSFNPSLDQGFENVFADGLVDGSLLFDSDAGVMESMSPKSRMDLQSLFAQTTSAFDPPRSLEYDSGSSTDSVTTPQNHASLPGPDKMLFITQVQDQVKPTASGPLQCSCLQELVKLVYQLEDLRYSQASGPAIDAVLKGVKMAEGPWRGLMQCNHCQNKDTYKEAFLLFSMSIRILLVSVQTLSGGVYHTELTSKVTVSIGTFSLPEESKLEVIEMSMRKALHAIAAALVHLWERAGKPRPTPSTDQGMINDAPITPISHHSTTIDDLTSAFSGSENIISLLSRLQFLMNATEGELRASAC